MQTSRLVGTAGLLLSCVLASATPAFSESSDGSAKQQASGAPFKLHSTYERFLPEMILPEGFKLPPKVDGVLVQQIMQMRTALPSWHGVHTLTPGPGGSGR